MTAKQILQLVAFMTFAPLTSAYAAYSCSSYCLNKSGEIISVLVARAQTADVAILSLENQCDDTHKGAIAYKVKRPKLSHESDFELEAPTPVNSCVKE